MFMKSATTYRNCVFARTVVARDNLLEEEEGRMYTADAKSVKLEFQLRFVVEPDEDEYHAYCPALKGLHTGGATAEEALENAKDAAVAYILSLINHGDPIPIGIRVPTTRRKPVWQCWSPEREYLENIAVQMA